MHVKRQFPQEIEDDHKVYLSLRRCFLLVMWSGGFLSCKPAQLHSWGKYIVFTSRSYKINWSGNWKKKLVGNVDTNSCKFMSFILTLSTWCCLCCHRLKRTVWCRRKRYSQFHSLDKVPKQDSFFSQDCSICHFKV